MHTLHRRSISSEALSLSASSSSHRNAPVRNRLKGSMSASNLRQQARLTTQMEACEPQGLPIRRKSLVSSSFSSSLSSTVSSSQLSCELNWGLRTGKASIKAANPSAIDIADRTTVEPLSVVHHDCTQLTGADTYEDACSCSVTTGIRSLSLPPWRKNVHVDLRRRKAQQLKRMARQRNLTLAQHYAREYCASPERSPLGNCSFSERDNVADIKPTITHSH